MGSYTTFLSFNSLKYFHTLNLAQQKLKYNSMLGWIIKVH